MALGTEEHAPEHMLLRALTIVTRHRPQYSTSDPYGHRGGWAILEPGGLLSVCVAWGGGGQCRERQTE